MSVSKKSKKRNRRKSKKVKGWKHRWETRSFLFILAIILVTLSLVVVSYWDDYKAYRLAKLREWPLPPVPKEAVWGNKLPPLPAFVPAFDWPWGRAMVEFIVKNYPDLAINQELCSKMLSGEVIYGCEKYKYDQAIAFFQPVSKEVDQEGYLIDPIGSFSFSCDELQQLKEPIQIPRLWTALSHEVVHYWQFLRELAQGKIKEGQNDSCDTQWQNELEAYGAQCRQLVEWGMKYVALPEERCIYVLTPYFQQALFKSIFENDQGEVYASGCLARWAELAGHPHPEAFRDQ